MVFLMNQKDCLRVLEFEDVESPSLDEIKKRWKELCRKHHPDLGGDKEDFLRITHAYKILTDPSYAHAQKNSMDDTDLTVNIQYVLTFEDAFAGKRKCMVTYSIFVFDPETNDLVENKDGDTIPTESQTFEVLPGAFQKEPLVFTGKGNKKGDRRGDLRILFQVKKHPTFTPERFIMGWNIVSNEVFMLHELLKGTRKSIRTMRGLRTITVPPGTAPGEVISIRGAGVNGNHKVVVNVKFPSKQDLKSENYKGMDIKWEDSEDEDADADKYERDFANAIFENSTRDFSKSRKKK